MCGRHPPVINRDRRNRRVGNQRVARGQHQHPVGPPDGTERLTIALQAPLGTPQAGPGPLVSVQAVSHILQAIGGAGAARLQHGVDVAIASSFLHHQPSATQPAPPLACPSSRARVQAAQLPLLAPDGITSGDSAQHEAGRLAAGNTLLSLVAALGYLV